MRDRADISDWLWILSKSSPEDHVRLCKKVFKQRGKSKKPARRKSAADGVIIVRKPKREEPPF